MRKPVDFLIVGCGLAALSIARELQEAGQDWMMIGLQQEGSASDKSSGIINPVTGRRFVKTWNYDRLSMEFLPFYQNLEHQLGLPLIRESMLMQELQGPEEENQWLARTADPDYTHFLKEGRHLDAFLGKLHTNVRLGLVQPVFQIDVEPLLKAWTAYFRRIGRLVDRSFNVAECSFQSEGVIAGDWLVKKGLIFAEGYRMLENPFFNWMPLWPLKGECMIIDAAGLQLKAAFKSNYTLVPLRGDRYWCGSSFELNDRSPGNTRLEIGRQLAFLDQKLPSGYAAVSEEWGIRPATRDRRPIIGPHPMEPRALVINGFGTKGYSVAPHCARALARFLTAGEPIPDQMLPGRFIKKGYVPILPV
ncbi:MAG TPA: FAD-binding oxidoreductase [Saprospiraceae bacterium]|nr:FAD-binding oxidoreductase [Saprospiraceae bacterium]